MDKWDQDVYAQYKGILGDEIILKNPDHLYECNKSKSWINSSNMS